MMMYANDYDGWLLSSIVGCEAGGYSIWNLTLMEQGYIQPNIWENRWINPTVRKNANVFLCPNDQGSAYRWDQGSGTPSYSALSYGLNNDTRAGSDPYFSAYRIGKVKVPSEKAWAADRFGSYVIGSSSIGIPPHMGGNNFLFFDGHVKWMSFDDVPMKVDRDGNSIPYNQADIDHFWTLTSN